MRLGCRPGHLDLKLWVLLLYASGHYHGVNTGFNIRTLGNAITHGLSAKKLGPEKAVPISTGDAEWESMGLLGPEDHWAILSVSCLLQGVVGLDK